MKDYLDTKHIFLDNPATTQEEVLDFIVAEALKSGVTCDAKALKEAFQKREAEGSTGMMGGFAIPHATAACIEKPALFLIKTASPIPWQTMDDKDVQVVIALLLPADSSTKHLSLLAKIAALLMQPNFTEHVLETNDAAEIAKSFNQGLA